MVTRYITKKTGELKIYTPRNSRVIRVDDETFELVKNIPRTGRETNGDVVKKIIREYRERNKIMNNLIHRDEEAVKSS